MGLRWEDERYVRLYTRDTVDWLGLSFPAQGLFCLLLRKVDRAGILSLGRHGKKAVAVAVGHGHQWAMLEKPLEELLGDGCVRIEGDHLVIPNFIEAQEANQSDAARKRAQREKARARVTKCDGGGTQDGDPGHAAAQGVTGRHETGTECHAVTDAVPNVTPPVTPSLAVPSRAVPSRAEPAEPQKRVTPSAPPPAVAAEDEPRRQLEVLDLTTDKPPLPDPGPSPFERVIAHWFTAWERAGRGKHSSLTGAEGATVKRLVRQLGADELVARMDRALGDAWFLEHGDLLLFAKQRDKFAQPGKAPPAPRIATVPASPITAFTGGKRAF